MIKEKTRKFFTLLRFMNDVLVIYASFIIGYTLKFKLFIHLSDVKYYPAAQVEAYLNVLWFISALWIISFVFNGLYKDYRGTLSWMKEVSAMIKAILVATLLTFAFTFIFKGLPQSKYVIVYAAISSFLLLFITRGTINTLKNFLHTRHIGNKKSLIIGSGKIGQELAEKMLLYPELGFNYIATISDRKPKKLNFHLKDSFKYFGKANLYKKTASRHDIQAIFITLDNMEQEELAEIISFCKSKNILLRFTPSKYQFKTGSVDFDEMDGIPLLGVSDLSFSASRRITKRFFDLVVTIPLLIFFAPVMLIIALLIKKESTGPAFYRQERLTRGGRTFTLLKYRSMKIGSEKGNPTLATKDQKARTTKIGYFLRKTSLDELPQLINVIKGDMSLIGPRPERHFFHEKYAKTIPNWDDRMLVRGGITGWAQMNGRAELTAEPQEKLAYDLFYIDNWSIMFDIKIAFNTILNVILQRNVF